jgi:hypothetical protein
LAAYTGHGCSKYRAGQGTWEYRYAFHDAAALAMQGGAEAPLLIAELGRAAGPAGSEIIHQPRPEDGALLAHLGLGAPRVPGAPAPGA